MDVHFGTCRWLILDLHFDTCHFGSSLMDVGLIFVVSVLVIHVVHVAIHAQMPSVVRLKSQRVHFCGPWTDGALESAWLV